MVHSIQFFTSVTYSAQISVRLPNGDMVKVTHIGTVQVSATLILENVLCIPSFSFNLISISKLTKILLVVASSFLITVFFRTYCIGRWLGWVRDMEDSISCSALIPSLYQLLFPRFYLVCILLFVIPVSVIVTLILLWLLILPIMLIDCGITD